MSFKGQLFPFQKEAVSQMVDMKKLLVAYEMGLGKTVLTIAAVEELIESGKISGGLVICPASIKLQWARMVEQFTGDGTRALVVQGELPRRAEQYRTFKEGGAEYLILNPEQMVNDWEMVSKLPRDFIVADEATWFKNFAPQRSKKIKRLKATYQWALTGQPIENRAEEAFSIMQWVDPTVLGDFRNFDAAFIKRDPWGKVRLYRNLPTLHRLLADHMVRRTRAEVADQLPAVTEQTVYVDLDPEGAKLYRRMVRDLERDLAEAINTWGDFSLSGFYQGEEQGAARGRIMSKMVCMRMLCDHPELLRISASHFGGKNSSSGRSGSEYAYELEQVGALEKLKKSPKLNDTVELITEILEADPTNKIVVFSFFRDMLDLIALATEDLTRSVLFTGAVNIKGRDRAKQQFADDPNTRLFLSSDAGGIGLDLPMANYLISYDLPWSAGAYAQRQSRIIRLSSEWPEITLLSTQISESIEEYQDGLLRQKAKIAAAVVDGKGISNRGSLSLSLKSLSEFLRTRVV